MDMMLEQFKTIFDRPEKVKRLRETILDLAVRGKLVKQDPNDEPASVLIERIKEEKERLVKEGKIKREKPLPEIREDEKPYELPRGWEWVRLGNIGDWGAGTTPSRSNPEFYGGNINWIKTGELNDTIIEVSEEKITELALKKCSLRLNKPGDILIAMYGATIGKLGILNCEATTNQACCACTTYNGINNKYLYTLLLAMRSEFRSQGAGGAQPNISRQKITNTVVMFPPLQEQKRIVEKVDSLMTFCDKLEKALEKKVHYGELSAKSIFNAVGSVSNVKELEETLRFILLNFKDLSLGDNAVKELKNCILQLAVQGKFVPQDPNDEPAEVLLEKIKEEKERLIKEGKIKREKPLGEISEDERPFELPDGWKWVRMRRVAENIHYGYTASAIDKETGVRFLRITDIQNSKVNWSTVPFCDIEEKKLSTCLLKNNDILIARTGGTIGKSFIVKNVNNISVFASYLIRVIPLVNTNADYLKFFLETPLYWKQLIEKSQGTGQPNVNAVSLSELMLPIPPLKEQKRIVEKVNSLMVLCDELEKKIEKQKSYSNRLMESILKDSFKA